MRLPTQLLKRNPDSHKGDFGHIFILAGSLRFSGAAVLCAEAAMRSGAGLVTLGIPRSLADVITKIKIKEVMILPLPETREKTLSEKAFKDIDNFLKKCDILTIGPGLSVNDDTQKLVRRILAEINKPVIIDADGLNALINHLDILKKAAQKKSNMIITPHPDEMARLLGTDVQYIQKHRIEVAQDFAKRFSLTLVLKGRHTVVTDNHGNLYKNQTGNPGMSSAGSGDVLAGMIGAFLGQGLSEFDAAKYGVYLHGLAGDLAAKEKTEISLIASDIIAKISEALKRSGSGKKP